MNRKSILFVSFAAISIFIITIVFFSIKIGISASDGKTHTREQFSLLVQKTIDLIEVNNGISDTFINSYVSALNQQDNIGAVLISNADEIYFAHPLNSSLLKVEESQRYTIQTNSSIVSVYSSTIPLDKDISITITAALYHITPSQMYSYARTAFMIILITTLGVFFIIVFQYAVSKNIPDRQKSDVVIPDDYEITLDTSIVDSIPEPVFETEKIEKAENNSDSFLHNDIIEKTDLSDSPLGQRVSDPLGLFSKDTGFGWESYLETRLDSELARAASSEQDLVLIILRIKDLPRTTPHIKKISAVLLETIKFRDLIFEYGSDGYACIIQEMDLDMAMKLSEKLYSSLQTVLKENNVLNTIGIGISTRTLRIIPGSRILQESSQACDKSFEEEGLPIVAFRVNPDKYRKFLTEVDE